MTSDSQPDQGERDVFDYGKAYDSLPEFRRAQRARLILDFNENGERQHSAQTGWAQLDGPWLHWLDDEWDHWQTFAAHAVLCLDWECAGASDEQDATT